VQGIRGSGGGCEYLRFKSWGLLVGNSLVMGGLRGRSVSAGPFYDEEGLTKRPAAVRQPIMPQNPVTFAASCKAICAYFRTRGYWNNLDGHVLLRLFTAHSVTCVVYFPRLYIYSSLVNYIMVIDTLLIHLVGGG
jgi:hypothetical protein